MKNSSRKKEREKKNTKYADNSPWTWALNISMQIFAKFIIYIYIFIHFLCFILSRGHFIYHSTLFFISKKTICLCAVVIAAAITIITILQL